VDDVVQPRRKRLGDVRSHRLVPRALGRLELGLELIGALVADLEEAERDHHIRVVHVPDDVCARESLGEPLRRLPCLAKCLIVPGIEPAGRENDLHVSSLGLEMAARC
jgi:hypothetical protein